MTLRIDIGNTTLFVPIDTACSVRADYGAGQFSAVLIQSNGQSVEVHPYKNHDLLKSDYVRFMGELRPILDHLLSVVVDKIDNMLQKGEPYGRLNENDFGKDNLSQHYFI